MKKAPPRFSGQITMPKPLLPALLLALFAALMIIPPSSVAQSQTAPTDGMKDNTPAVHAFINATIVSSPGNVHQNATLVIRDGVVESVGPDAEVPADARIWDMDGKTLYPAFIDAHSGVGMQDPRKELDRGSLSWNPQLRAHLTADGEFNPEDDGSEVLRSQGFTTALSVPPLGIFRGRATVMNLGEGTAADRVVRRNVAQSVSLARSREIESAYPTSPMGVIALIRQTLYDAGWYEKAHQVYKSNPAGLQRPETNAVLASLRDAANGGQALLFETNSDEEILRALRFTEEFDITPWIRGNGYEYQILDVLSERNVPLILPLAFPETPEIKTPEDALNETLSTLRHWYLAPENPARLAQAGVDFSFTTDELDDPSHFLRNLRKAVESGLEKETALAALTTNPAQLFGLEATHGTLASGKLANIVVADGDIFKNDTRIIDVWVEGTHFSITEEDQIDPKGEWQITSTKGTIDGKMMVRKANSGRLEGAITLNDSDIELTSVSVHDASRRFRADFPGSELDLDGPVRLTASYSDERLYGWAELAGRERIQWQGKRITPYPDTGQGESSQNDENSQQGENSRHGENSQQKGSPKAGKGTEPGVRSTAARDLELAEIRPAMAFGRQAIPEQPRHVLVRNATIWTMGPDGILEQADMLVTEGEIAEIGHDLRAPRNAVEIDAGGKHVTPGLIDPHIHSGVSGVNEVGNAITAEVRMGDVLNIHNIWMYRQLAGGLTTANVLHGSANPIGGQNVLVKMRWGALSDDLKFENAPRTVKFALGENPKRVGSNRYPDTRMGVEQLIADRFHMARDYESRWQEWERNGEGIPPRRDLRLEALVEILNGELRVESHSYRQDEILMLMRLADEFDISVNAFHHGVEAFKVAPELAEKGVGAVVWSDWSSFKIEAYDATLYNARLLDEAGVLTTLHSDNSHIASRMNWEAAKMVRAGVAPETAMSMITSSPAVLMGIDDRVGSLEPGKDADFVIWNGDPLSTFTKAEQTWIEGRKYFDLEEDARLRRTVEEERARLIRRVMEENNE